MKTQTTNKQQIDLDDYVNKLIREIEFLKNTVTTLKLEIKTQRKEIASLRAERRNILNNDNALGFKCIDW